MPQKTATNDDAENIGNEEFDQAFEEIAAGESPSDQDADNEPAPTSNDADDNSFPDDNVSDDQPPSANKQIPTGQEQSEDIWANVPTEARAAYEASLKTAQELETKLTRQNGRVSALDRQLHQLRKHGQPSTEQKVPADVSKVLESDKFKQFREEYPEIADPINEFLSAAAEQLAGVSTVVEAANQSQDEAILNEQLSILQSDHPDWADYAKDSRWNDWIATQPRHIREAQARNSVLIVDGSEASDVLARFKQAFNIGNNPKPVTPDPRRERQLEGARRPGFSAPSVAAGDPDNFDAAFDTAAKKVDAQTARSRKP